MDALNFAYWLNGFAELHGDTPPTAEQWVSIREHLGLVLTKVTPFVPPAPVTAGVPLKDWFPDRQTAATPRFPPARVECLAGRSNMTC